MRREARGLPDQRDLPGLPVLPEQLVESVLSDRPGQQAVPELPEGLDQPEAQGEQDRPGLPDVQALPEQPV